MRRRWSVVIFCDLESHSTHKMDVPKNMACNNVMMKRSEKNEQNWNFLWRIASRHSCLFFARLSHRNISMFNHSVPAMSSSPTYSVIKLAMAWFPCNRYRNGANENTCWIATPQLDIFGRLLFISDLFHHSNHMTTHTIGTPKTE